MVERIHSPTLIQEKFFLWFPSAPYRGTTRFSRAGPVSAMYQSRGGVDSGEGYQM